MASVEGKRVLITGGARGIGFCTAQEFAKRGAEVILADLDQAALEQASQKLGAFDTAVHTFQVDVSQRDQVSAMAEDLIERLGGLDVLINNAGVGYTGPLVKTDFETWEKLLRVNFWGALHTIYAFLPWMLEHRQGHIVNVSSGQAFFRLPTWGAYATSKAALASFSEVLYWELRNHGIKVTTVYPFMVNTGFYRNVDAESLGTRIAMKLLPFYSDSPQRVARIIYKAVVKGKRVEMVNPINDVGFYGQVVPPMSNTISTLCNWFFART
ncbi:MAG: SDR family oxidoreductase [Bradymonadales bacterium]|nr:SDR family oxidoreductase [Bradymonadales bacterium]